LLATQSNVQMHFPAMFDFEIGPNFGVCGTGTQNQRA